VEVEARLVDANAADLPPADVAVANISLADVERLRLDAGHAVTSGYLAADRPRLAGYRSVDRREVDGWAADLHARER
jgi:nucleoside 2-deoxyribosyltransferase